MKNALLLILAIPFLLFAQSDNKKNTFEPLKYFTGTWDGTCQGQPGNGTSLQEYKFIMNGKFLQITNKTTFKPQEKNPKGEVHEDLGIISFDKSLKQFILRQFHVESFVNQYAMDKVSEDGKTFVFVTTAIENIPKGWRAKETYKIVNDNEFTSVFELAEPGKDFEVYTETHYKRRIQDTENRIQSN